MKMEVTKRSILEVDYCELEETITEYFKEFHGFDPKQNNNQSFYFTAMQECGNDSYHDFSFIDGELSEDDLEDLQKVIDKKDFYEAKYNTGLFLNYLCSKGVIDPGDYLVWVSW